VTITIDVRPYNRRGQYTASLDGRDLCTSPQPFLDAARVLLAEGVEPDTVLVMRWAESGTTSLRSTVGVAAKLTVEECSDGVPRFRSYRSYPSAVASHVASNDSPAIPLQEAAE
jgi:hypothetical protein